MSGKSDLLYLKEWAFYLKNRQFRNLSVVLTHRPANRQELAFLLEIVSQLFILRSIQASLIAVLQRPALLVLTQALNEHSVGGILCIQSVKRLLGLHQQMQTQQLISESNQNLQAFAAGVLAQVSGYGVQIQKNQTIDQLKMIGKWGILLKTSGNFKYEEVLAQLKCWWTVTKVINKQINQDFKDLLMIWFMHNQERSMEMLIQSQKSHEKEENILMEWFNYFYDSATKWLKLKDIQPTIVENISKQIRQLTKMCQIKNNKNKKQILGRIKLCILGRFKGVHMTQQLAVIFSIIFCLLQIASKESEVDFSTLLTIQDLISNQHIFYSSLWTLQSMDKLHYFPTFTTYMKNNSAMPILLIHRKISNQIKLPSKNSIIDIQDAMINKKTSILFQFNYKPLELTEYLLQYYLNASNIIMPHNQRAKRRRSTRLFLKPLVYDPLHFFMVKEVYWNDSFHRNILQISLWICLDCYSKWLQQIKIKETTDKQLNEYLKKLNLSLVIFLLSLDFPTKMLQYFPIQSDAIKQIIIQPIFPTIILKNKFFFQTYKQKSDTIETKQERGLQHWILPWSHVLAQPKTITNFIHSNRGYELAFTMLTHNKTAIDKNYAQFIVFRITTELQSMGINVMGIQAQNKLKLTFFDAERRKYMIALLRESQKINQTAKRLLQLLI